MGAGASKNVESSKTADEQAFYSERPVRFSPSLIQHLSDLPNPADSNGNSPSASRQSTLDEHIRARINAELNRLRAAEEEIQSKIAAALEKDNLDKEGGSSAARDEQIRSSQALQQELAEVERKIAVHREKRDLDKNFPEVVAARKGLVACYLKNKERPLDCWSEAADFRLAVKQAEQRFVEAEAVSVA